MENNIYLDTLDFEIINELQLDGRASLTSIANKYNVSEPTVRKRLKKLTENNIIQIVAVADPFKLGFNIAATIKIEADIDRADRVGEELKKVNEIWYIALNTGGATFDVEALVPGMEDLNNLLTGVIWKIDGIKKTETSVVLSYIKRDYNWKVTKKKP